MRKNVRHTLVEVGKPYALCHQEVEVIFRINLTIVWMNNGASEKVTAEGEVGADTAGSRMREHLFIDYLQYFLHILFHGFLLHDHCVLL